MHQPRLRRSGGSLALDHRRQLLNVPMHRGFRYENRWMNCKSSRHTTVARRMDQSGMSSRKEGTAVKDIRARKSAKTPAKRRPRRSKEEIVDRMIHAAVEEFSAYGYSATRTAAIAQRADVVEPLLFKYFGSKANLFQRAIFQPLDAQYHEFQQRYRKNDQQSGQRLSRSREYIREQYEFLSVHSRMFMSLALNEAFESDEFEGMAEVDGIQSYLTNMVHIVETRLTGEPRIKPKLLARISFATLLSSVLFREWLFPDEVASDDEIIEGVIDFIMEGVKANEAQP